MSGFSHVRWKFWHSSERYTDAQARELRCLRELYTTHLMTAFGPMPDSFALRAEGDEYYPRYTAATLTPVLPASAPPTAPVGARPLKPFADTLLTTLAVFEAARAQRWVGNGHPNDPTRLFGLFIRQTCERWLTHAPLNATTLNQVTALRRYLDALARYRVFTNEGQDQGSMGVLLHNLGAPLALLEKRLQQEIRLQSAREHFAEVKARMAEALEAGAGYLFHGLAQQDRSSLPFSWINLQAGIISSALSKTLQSREGLLLKQWLYAPGMKRLLLLQVDAKQSVLSDSAPVSLLGTETPTPLLDAKGQAEATWISFLAQDPVLSEQLPSALRDLTLGISPVLQSTEGCIFEAVQLHGLMETLIEYQFYIHQCWQLAGFGGDHCVYDQMVEAITSILGELRVFSEKLRERVQAFQEKLDAGYRRALAARSDIGWQANYQKAKAAQEQWLALLQGCENHLQRLLAHARDTGVRAERQDLAAQAYQALRAAPSFLNRARQQVGLAPRPAYPGLATVAAALPAPPPSTDLRWDQVTAIFLPTSAPDAAWLGNVCHHTPQTPPWRVFRGSYRRYCYLQAPERLKSLSQDLLQLQLVGKKRSRVESAALIVCCQQALQDEQARIRQLRQGLWWPFHRASLRFFDAWEQGIAHQLRTLAELLRTSAGREGVSVQGVQQRLLVEASVPVGKPQLPIALEKKHESKVALPVQESPLPLPVVTPSLASLRARFAEDQARDQQMLAEMKSETKAFREESQRNLASTLEGSRQLLVRLQKEHQEAMEEVREEREAVAHNLIRARLERLTHSAPDLLRRPVPLAQARSSYGNFCWQGSSSPPRHRLSQGLFD